MRCWLTHAVTWSKRISASALVYLPPFFPNCVLEVPRPTCVSVSVCPRESHEAYVQLPYGDLAQLIHTHKKTHTQMQRSLTPGKGWPLDGISTTAWNIRTKYSLYFSLCFFVFIDLLSCFKSDHSIFLFCLSSICCCCWPLCLLLEQGSALLALDNTIVNLYNENAVAALSSVASCCVIFRHDGQISSQ